MGNGGSSDNDDADAEEGVENHSVVAGIVDLFNPNSDTGGLVSACRRIAKGEEPTTELGKAYKDLADPHSETGGLKGAVDRIIKGEEPATEIGKETKQELETVVKVVVAIVEAVSGDDNTSG